MTILDDFYNGARSAFIVTTSAGFDAQARLELRRLLPGSRATSLFLKGNILLFADFEEGEVLARLGEAETRLISHVFPVQAQVDISTDRSGLQAVAEAASAVGRIRPGETFVVRAHRRGQHEWPARELERSVATRLQELTGEVGEILPPIAWQVTVQIYQGVGYVGVNHPAELMVKELQVTRKYAPGERPLNRAQWKLREALEEFGLELPAEAWALDLGSAPGGWALVLAERSAHVVAVDPAELDPSVTARANVEHLKMRAEEVLGRLEYRERFDLLTCDMNIDPAEAAGILVRMAPALKPGAPAIMTIKYITHRRSEHEREAREVLGAAYEDMRIKRMPHNARETTAVMVRRP